jgi:TonB-dependent SusC/RagA subfamily outer membrane receptor
MRTFQRLSVARFCMLSAVTIFLGCAGQTSKQAPEPRDPNSIEPAGRGMQELFAGRFPGVEVLRAQNGGISIRIRGTSSFVGSSEPLYIIDGTKVQSGAGGLLFLDPQDIARIEVLKDIGSTSIYGSEGANGVIIITTKWH